MNADDPVGVKTWCYYNNNGTQEREREREREMLFDADDVSGVGVFGLSMAPQ